MHTIPLLHDFLHTILRHALSPYIYTEHFAQPYFFFMSHTVGTEGWIRTWERLGELRLESDAFTRHHGLRFVFTFMYAFMIVSLCFDEIALIRHSNLIHVLGSLQLWYQS